MTNDEANKWIDEHKVKEFRKILNDVHEKVTEKPKDIPVVMLYSQFIELLNKANESWFSKLLRTLKIKS